MKHLSYDCAVIGGGAAGMTAAKVLSEQGRSVALIERDAMLGGILNQCIHNGFGLHWFKEELTGPEYAERFADQIAESSVDVYLSMTVTEMRKQTDGTVGQVMASSAKSGVICFDVGAIILAMGCRERNRGNIGIAGTRPAGIFTAGLAQRLVNIEGYIPGSRCVIIGSGDIGLIMARRMTWIGVKVEAVVEIQPYPAGLTRNIVQCLNDFGIPLYLSHEVTEIYGKDRVEGVHIAPVDRSSEGFNLECDTILLSVGLVPDNELIRSAGMSIRPETSGPEVDETLMCTCAGVFACGNVLHVHDLVDWVSEEARRCALTADAWLGSATKATGGTESGSTGVEFKADQYSGEFAIRTGANLRYVLPHRYRAQKPARFSMRSMIVSNKARVELRSGSTVLASQSLRHIQPSEMIHVDIDPSLWPEHPENGVLEFHIVSTEVRNEQ